MRSIMSACSVPHLTEGARAIRMYLLQSGWPGGLDGEHDELLVLHAVVSNTFRCYLLTRVRAQNVCISCEAGGRGGIDGEHDELLVLHAEVSNTFSR